MTSTTIAALDRRVRGFQELNRSAAELGRKLAAFDTARVWPFRVTSPVDFARFRGPSLAQLARFEHVAELAQLAGFGGREVPRDGR